MRDPNKNGQCKLAFATISEAEILKIQEDAVPENRRKATKSVVKDHWVSIYILKQLFFSILVKAAEYFLPLFTSISKNNC